MLFAQSLQSNTKLILLDLSKNNFTNEGIKTLYESVYNSKSLNAMHDANSTCQIVLFGQDEESPDGVNKSMLTFNNFKESDNQITTLLNKIVKDGPLARENTLLSSMIWRLAVAANESKCSAALLRQGRARRLKILHALQDSNTGILNMHYLKEIPLQYIPHVLVFIQECGGWSQSEEKNLDRVYQVIKSRPGVLMSEFAAGSFTKKRKFRRRRRQSSQCSCSIM